MIAVLIIGGPGCRTSPAARMVARGCRTSPATFLYGGSAAVPSFTVTIARDGQVRRVGITGELDLHTGSRLAAAVALIPAGRAVLLDLAGISFCDCAGFSALERAGTDLAARGTLAVTGTPACVQRIAGLRNGHGPPAGLHRTG